ncbi:MAG TPA: AI-2E family transporter [Gemmatimonadales bacterium]|nr:AI-2E family transporter [Gemmatimonadales bacterium]
MALFVAVLVVWFILRVVGVLLLVFLAILLAVYLSAITDYMERRWGARRWLGLTMAVVATLAGVTGIAVLLLPPVIEQTRALIGGLPQTLTNIQNVLARWASQYPVLDQTDLANPSSGVISGVVSDAVGFLSGSILSYVRGGGTLFIEGASVVVMALYLARQPALYRDGLISLFSPRHRVIATRVFDDAAATLRAWVVGQLIAMAVLALLTAIGLWILGVPYWLAFGIFTGMVAIVPFFGSLFSTILPALFVVASGDWVKVLLVLLLGVVVHVFEANVIVPRIMQHEVKLPPVLTIASVLIMGTLLGAVGLIVAVPVLCVTMVLIRHILHGQIYGEPGRSKPAVLVPTEPWTGVERRRVVTTTAK